MKIGAAHFCSGFRPRIGVRGVLSPESPMALWRPRKGMKMVGRRMAQTGRAAGRAPELGTSPSATFFSVDPVRCFSTVVFPRRHGSWIPASA